MINFITVNWQYLTSMLVVVVFQASWFKFQIKAMKEDGVLPSDWKVVLA